MKSKSLLRASILAGLMLAGGAYAAELQLFAGPNFRGPDMTINGSANNLDRSGFNDRAESAIVRSGRWEVCTDANYGGYCAVLNPGQYRFLQGPLQRSISSAREIAPLAYDDRQYYRYAPVETYPRAYDPYRYSALEVYTLPGFRGSTLKFDRSAPALDPPATNEGVASLIVREGTWELCSGYDHTGSCRVYEPGRYPRLGSFEGSPVGSLRRIG